MAVDFDAAVLGPAFSAFSRPIIVTPLASQPGALAYIARAIWDRRNIDVEVEGGILSSAILTVDVRLSEFLVPVKQGDRIDIPSDGTSPALGAFMVDDDDPDSGGASKLTLKRIDMAGNLDFSDPFNSQFHPALG